MNTMIKHLEPLIAKSVQRKYSSGSTVLYQGEAPRSACILVDGIIKVYTISPEGEEQIILFLVEGDIFPLSWLFKKNPAVMFFYEALTNCRVAMVPPDELRESIMETPEKMASLIDYFAKNYTASLVRVNALQQSKAKDKLVYMLYYLCRRHGEEVLKNGRTVIPISLTHQNFASLVGLTRETTAIEMNKLKKQRVISYRQQKYYVDIPKLLEIMGEDSFRDIKV
jgi:CRP/FNR family transcriptional regulator, cyclic AMP receptor protein